MSNFLNEYLWVISIFIFIWFAIDCIRYKRFVVDKIEWTLYLIFSIFTTISFI